MGWHVIKINQPNHPSLITLFINILNYLIYTHTHTHTHAHTYTYMYIHTHIYTHTHAHTCTHIYIHVHTHICTHTHTHTCTYTHTHAHTWTHIHTHSHIHTCTHTHKYIYIYIYIYVYLPSSSTRIWFDTRSIFERSFISFNSSFPSPRLVVILKLKSLSTLLFTHSKRVNSLSHSLPRVFALRNMQTASSRIWTRVTVSIFYDDNHYTASTFPPLYIYIYIYIERKRERGGEKERERERERENTNSMKIYVSLLSNVMGEYLFIMHLPNPSTMSRMLQFFGRSKAGMNSIFLFLDRLWYQD